MVQILSLTIFALLFARVMRAPHGTWRWIVGAAVLVLIVSQLLPSGNAFREDVRDSAETLLWLGLALVPVAAYALLIRRIRRRTIPPEERGNPAHPVGLVLVPDDTALVRDTEAAVAAEAGGAPDAHVSVGWRNEAGEMVGHARLRLARDVAALELLWVAAGERGHGIGSRLLAQAGEEARLRGARDIVATATCGTTVRFLEKCGYRAYGRLETGSGAARTHLHKALA